MRAVANASPATCRGLMGWADARFLPASAHFSRARVVPAVGRQHRIRRSASRRCWRVAFEYGHTMCAFCTSFDLLARHARHVDGQLGLDAETGRDLTDADLAGDGGVGRQRDLGLAGHELQRAQEAGRGRRRTVAPGWCRPPASRARGRQLDVQHVVGGDGTAFAAAGRGGLGGVQNPMDIGMLRSVGGCCVGAFCPLSAYVGLQRVRKLDRSSCRPRSSTRGRW